MTNHLERLSERLGALDSEQRRYALEAFAGHLRDAQQYRRLGFLFEHDEWMVARFEAEGGAYDGYLADLAIAWPVEAARARLSDRDRHLPKLAALDPPPFRYEGSR